VPIEFIDRQTIGVFLAFYEAVGYFMDDYYGNYCEKDNILAISLKILFDLGLIIKTIQYSV